MVSLDYRVAYSEVLEILKYVPKDYVNKIPNEMLQTFKQNANENYEFKYNVDKTLIEQNVSKTARYIIAILFRDYWATPEQRDKIIAKEKYDLDKIEQQKIEKYSYDNLFKTRPKDDIAIDNNEMIIYKETIFKKIIEKIKRILKM